MSISSVVSTNSNCTTVATSDFSNQLKTLDYIPAVSIASGVTRVAFGALQTIVSVAQDFASFVQFCSNPSKEKDVKVVKNNSHSSLYNPLYICGKANMARGMIAMLPVFGNLALYLYDHSSFANDWEERTARMSIMTI